MCGIAGIVRAQAQPGQEDAVLRMCTVMSHRGPDDSGVHADGGSVLGHVRLSIIDLAGGHQPLSNEDGSVWVTFNGEIYNYRELHSELVHAGHRFRTNTDTEVLVHLYEDHGVRAVEKLNGMFAFAIWDARRRSVVLCRDHVGVKPLYYAQLRDGLAFASELKALLEVPGISRSIDREAIGEYLTLGYITAPRTPFVQIRKLPSGSLLEYDGSRVAASRYWTVPIQAPTYPKRIDDVYEEMRFLLEDATRLQLRADVPVGLYASGGLDSTAVMWAASRQGVSLEAFLCEFDRLRADSPFARIAAGATGMRLHEEQVSVSQAAALLPKLIWHQDEPLADPALVPCYLIAEKAARHVKVILNGTGGDELFGGYPRYRVRGIIPARWSARVGRGMAGLAAGRSVTRRVAAALDFRQRYLRRMTVLPESEVRDALGLPGPPVVADAADALFADSASSDASSAMMHYDLNVYLPGDLLMILDKMTMATSLESRVPLLDYRLVEFASRLPGRLKMRGGGLKQLMRDALRGRIPDTILDRPKQGFGPPISHWMRSQLGRRAREMLLAADGRTAALLGTPRVRSWLGAETARGSRSAYRLWLLLVLELWLRVFDGGIPARERDAATLLMRAGAPWM